MNSAYSSKIHLRWSDLDPNVHVRHSVYYDWGAQARMEILMKIGLSPQALSSRGVGVILMEESCKFRREIKYGDQITMLSNWQPEGPNGEDHLFSFVHRIHKGQDTFCAEINILGGWIDLKKRKLCGPPEDLKQLIDRGMT